jgi:hypothetical protein
MVYIYLQGGHMCQAERSRLAEGNELRILTTGAFVIITAGCRELEPRGPPSGPIRSAPISMSLSVTKSLGLAHHVHMIPRLSLEHKGAGLAG